MLAQQSLFGSSSSGDVNLKVQSETRVLYGIVKEGLNCLMSGERMQLRNSAGDQQEFASSPRMGMSGGN